MNTNPAPHVMMHPDAIERAAKAIYGTFIRRGPLAMRNERGNLIPETPEQAVERRWKALPERIRSEFLAEAEAALEAA